jgi:glyoxylase-like metal-dependent hydrolase (beta-lactamase superfamily II)
MKRFFVGGVEVIPISDGAFYMSPTFLTSPLDPGTNERDDQGRAQLPILAFFIPGEPNVLIDAGLGPDPSAVLDVLAEQVGVRRAGMGLHGDAGLVRRLDQVSVRVDDIDIVVISHLHADHIGWLVRTDATPMFPKAQVLLPGADIDHYLLGEQRSIPWATRDALRDLVLSGRFEAMDGEQTITPSITAIPAPGHTPGHTAFAISDGGQRAMVLGDSMYCPAQLTEIDVGAMHDIDPELARRTREMIARDAEAHATLTIGCHFPGGRAARLVEGRPLFD